MGSAVAIGSLIVAAVGTAAEISQRQKAAEAQQSLIRERQLQNKLASTQRSNRRAKKFQAVLSAQRATAAAHGISLSSPTFASIGLQSFEQFEQDNENAALNASFENNALNTEIAGSEAKATAGEWGAGLSFAGSAFQQVDLGEFGAPTPDVQTRGNKFDADVRNEPRKLPASFGVTI